MLEMGTIQTRGFHNIEQDGKIVGFTFRVRMTYYRGIWLSQLYPGKVAVDGEVFPKETIIWNVNGQDYTYDEVLKAGNVSWCWEDAAVIKVMKPGGLSQGYHDVEIWMGKSASYMPPFVDVFDDSLPLDHPAYRRGGHYQKKMLLVR